MTEDEYLYEQIKKASRILEDIFVHAIPREMHHPYKQLLSAHYEGNINGPKLTSQTGEAKTEENNVAHDVADKCKSGRRN